MKLLEGSQPFRDYRPVPSDLLHSLCLLAELVVGVAKLCLAGVFFAARRVTKPKLLGPLFAFFVDASASTCLALSSQKTGQFLAADYW